MVRRRGLVRTVATLTTPSTKNNPGTVNTLVGALGARRLGARRRRPSRRRAVRLEDPRIFPQEIQFPFFEHYLKDKGPRACPKANVFETGTNVWRKYDAWPPPTRSRANSISMPAASSAFDPPARSEGVDEYVSDPAHPVPFIELYHRHRAAALHGRRPALRLDAA